MASGLPSAFRCVSGDHLTTDGSYEGRGMNVSKPVPYLTLGLLLGGCFSIMLNNFEIRS